VDDYVIGIGPRLDVGGAAAQAPVQPREPQFPGFDHVTVGGYVNFRKPLFHDRLRGPSSASATRMSSAFYRRESTPGAALCNLSAGRASRLLKTNIEGD